MQAILRRLPANCAGEHAPEAPLPLVSENVF